MNEETYSQKNSVWDKATIFDFNESQVFNISGSENQSMHINSDFKKLLKILPKNVKGSRFSRN